MGDFINFLFKCDRRIDSDNDHVSTTVLHFRRSHHHRCRRRRRLVTSWSGGDRNYTDTTTILNASEVTVALPLYGE